MADLTRDIKHLTKDVKRIHDNLEHLNSHSRVCNELVKESNIREASELFTHLTEIDNLIHGVQEHVTHIEEHIDEETGFDINGKPLDIDDLKSDARHTSFDLKDIHSHIEHLIMHTELCREIIEPNAEMEIDEIKGHLRDLDDKAHELLEHINEIRGEISTKYSEFIWTVPEGFDEYLTPTKSIDSNHKVIEDTALKLVDGSSSEHEAIVNIFCFVRDFIKPESIDDHLEVIASKTLNSISGSDIAKSILTTALSRAVSIPSQIHFGSVSVKTWEDLGISENLDLPSPNAPIILSWPEFYIKGKWIPCFEIFDSNIDPKELHDRFTELGIKQVNQELDLQKWRRLDTSKFDDLGTFADPLEFISSARFTAPPCEIERRLFGCFFYTGNH
jgi:hypothetical protein